ncbi:polysaccharide biosynthesis/export family protein [Salinicola rhizosphaerae]|uniref:Capreomycidine hydroxylase n=1 Tax=Salinicola rhizosphaerae TaxID=1443141 RepID=A0ABQ3DLQ9_9GAMM|nr:polysaccharide biosynthesis/export family protein [Salinicola rhizosphaerae]GHB06942.1 capreomycidine hydroxylase [Salinicola rhizosphaerae]
MKHAASFFRAGCLVAVACLNASLAQAQSFDSGSGILPQDQQAQSMTTQTSGQSAQQAVNDQPRANWSSANYGPANQGAANANQPPVDPNTLPPFGANLFSGGFRGVMADGLNPGYTIKPGDQINLRVWGGTEMQSVLTVDSQGNVFLPGIGPLNVQGTSNSELNSRVTAAIKSVYPENVQVYTNLQGVQPVGVFVTGYVTNPGRYSGTPSDSLLYFLDQAGGIDQALGSYRQIAVKRGGKTIETVDLYDFLINGKMPQTQFRDGDTIVVEERGPAVAVVGDVEKPFRYELAGETLTGADVTDLARLRSGVNHVLLRGDRPDGPLARYLTLDEFRTANVEKGDEVMFSADQRAESIVVQVEGSYYGPSRYVLPRDAHLGEFLNAISVPKSMTSYQDVSIRRESVAEQQEQSLQDSLHRLEQTYLGYPSRTAKEAEIQVRQAELIQKFVQKASQVKPTGRLVVARNGDIANVRLQDGDVITIPESSDSVLLSGEVTIPQAMVFTPGMSAEDYIYQAGGFTPRADDDQVLVVHKNGAVIHAGDTQIRAGDEIMVLPAAPTSNIELASSITQILYQVAVATKVALDL